MLTITNAIKERSNGNTMVWVPKGLTHILLNIRYVPTPVIIPAKAPGVLALFQYKPKMIGHRNVDIKPALAYRFNQTIKGGGFNEIRNIIIPTAIVLAKLILAIILGGSFKTCC